jgi:hypothetical protein
VAPDETPISSLDTGIYAEDTALDSTDSSCPRKDSCTRMPGHLRMMKTAAHCSKIECPLLESRPGDPVENQAQLSFPSLSPGIEAKVPVGRYIISPE